MIFFEYYEHVLINFPIIRRNYLQNFYIFNDGLYDA